MSLGRSLPGHQAFLGWLEGYTEAWTDGWVTAMRQEISAYRHMAPQEIRAPVERHASLLRHSWQEGRGEVLLDFYRDLARKRVSERIRLADLARAVAIGERTLLAGLRASRLRGKEGLREMISETFREGTYLLLDCYQRAAEEMAAEARARLEASEAGAAKTWEEWDLLNQILSGIDVGIVVFDQDLNVVWLNRTMPKELLRVPSESGEGRLCKKVLNHDESECATCAVCSVLDGAPPVRQLIGVGPGKSGRDFLRITRPISGGNLKGPHAIEIYLDITAQLEAQRSLARTQELLKNILNSSVGGIISTDLAGRVTLFNRTAEVIFGYTEKEALGLLVADMYCGGRPEAHRVMDKLLAQEVLEDYRTTFYAKSGEQVPLRVTFSLLRDEKGTLLGTMGYCHDLRVEEALKKEVASRDQYLLSILQASMDGLVTLDARGRIASWNRGAAILFGVDAHGALGHSMEKFLPPKATREIPSSASQPPGTRRLEAKIPQGDRQIEVLVTRTEIRDSTTGERGASLVLKDVTELNRLQRELADAEHLAELGRLAASVAHEIKNPIAGLRGAMEMIAEERTSEESQNPVLQEALLQIRRLDSLVKELLSFAKPISLRLEPVPMHLLVESTLPFVQRSAEEAGVWILRQVPEDLPTTTVDAQQIQQVLVNLIMNGIQSTGPGGTVTVSAARRGPEIALGIQDTGSGITPGDLKRIFQPFFTTKHIGTGLGLSIVQRIVSAHAGRVEVDTRPGEGTTFTVYLPVEAGGV